MKLNQRGASVGGGVCTGRIQEGGRLGPPPLYFQTLTEKKKKKEGNGLNLFKLGFKRNIKIS